MTQFFTMSSIQHCQIEGLLKYKHLAKSPLQLSLLRASFHKIISLLFSLHLVADFLFHCIVKAFKLKQLKSLCIKVMYEISTGHLNIMTYFTISIAG